MNPPGNPDTHWLHSSLPVVSGTQLDQQIVAARGRRNEVDPFHPYHVLVESEYSAAGQPEDVLTVFLTNKECPFRCLMCDLWKNTTEISVPVGAIPSQIREALKSRRNARHIKLYNSGNFFDGKAIPRADHKEIAELLHEFDTVIVENHPKLCTDECLRFQQNLEGRLEIAMGLETSNERVLATLNKQMTTSDFAEACQFLRSNEIGVRTFILLRPPGVSESEGVEQAIASIKFAFDCGVECCAVIPTRAGNGIMEQLQTSGVFSPPTLRSLEAVIDEAMSWQRGRVLADLWDARQFGQCEACSDLRIERLNRMNLTQVAAPNVNCAACSLGRSNA